jgi:predicted transcriptional regulator
MSRRPSSSLTDGELRIMRVLWDLSRATGTEIIERLQATDATVPAYNSVLTMLRILERKGYVRHQKDGRAFTFEPLVDRQVARTSALTNLLTKFFDGSPALLVLDLFGHGSVDTKELSRLRALIDEGAAPTPRRRRKS